MAKKTEKTEAETKSAPVVMTITDEVESRPFTLNNHIVDNDETLSAVAFKGKRPDGKFGYRVVINGKEGDVKGSLPAAIKSAVEADDRNSKSWDCKASLKELFPTAKDNEPEVTEERKKEIAKEVPKLEKALDAEAKAESKTREMRLVTARVVLSIRSMCADKKEWSVFQESTKEGSAARDLVKNKNGVNEACLMAKVAEQEELFSCIPEAKMSAKSVAAFVATARNAAASAVVRMIKENPKADGKPVYDIKGLNTTNAAYNVMFDHVEDTNDVFAGADIDDDIYKAATVLINIHAKNWAEHENEDGTMPNLLDDGYAPVKREDGSPIVPTMFGLEGSDEMIAALARAAKAYTASSELAKVEPALNALKDAADKVKTEKRGIEDYTHEEAAKLLLGILAGRITEDAEETAQDLGGIVSVLADYVNRVAKGEATVAEIIAGDAGPTEDEAEDEADAV